MKKNLLWLLLIFVLCFSSFIFPAISISISPQNSYGDLGGLSAIILVTSTDNEEILKLTPGGMDRDDAKVVLNGRDITFTVGSGYGWDGGTRYDLSLNPGKPGNKTLEVTLAGRKSSVNFNYHPKADIVFLNVVDNEGFFEGGLSPEWAGYYIDSSSVKVTVNGRGAGFSVEKNTGCAGFTKGRIYVENNVKNSVNIKCVDYEGNTLEKNITLYDFSNYTVPAGTNFKYEAAAIGSKSGPFYKISALNGRVKVSDGLYYSAWRLNEGVLFSRPGMIYASIEAFDKGDTGIRIERQSGFRRQDKWVKIKELFFRVK